MIEKEVITSVKNATVLNATVLKEKSARDLRQEFLVEGKRTISDIKDASRIVKIFVKEKKPDLLEIAERFLCPVHIVSDAVFSKISDTVSAEGILAIVKKVDNSVVSGNRVLLLDRVRDPGNVGTLFRSAFAFGFQTVISIDSADPYSPKVVRGSMGAVLTLNIIEGTEESLSALLKGYEIYAADMMGEELKTVTASPRLALAVGNESNGLSAKIVSMATKLVKIAMPGEMESLNAGVAGSIIMYHFI